MAVVIEVTDDLKFCSWLIVLLVFICRHQPCIFKKRRLFKPLDELSQCREAVEIASKGKACKMEFFLLFFDRFFFLGLLGWRLLS